MFKSNQDYLKRVTVKPNYDRPSFDLPDLAGSDGNTYVVASKIHDCLKNNGFHKEAYWLTGPNNQHSYYSQANIGLIFKTKFDDHPNLLTRFLTLNPQEEDLVTNEDEEFVYIKKRKKTSVLNIPLFKKLLYANLSDVQKWYQENPSDFLQNNTFKRNALFYIEHPESLAWFLDKNKEEGLLDLFEMDVFNQTPLHAASRMENFVLLAKAMYETDPETTQSIFNRHDVFENGCFITMSQIVSGESKLVGARLDLFAEFLSMAILIDPENSQELLEERNLNKLLGGGKSIQEINSFRGKIEKIKLSYSLPYSEKDKQKIRI